ncbi:hypothetical protein JTE90_022733 [Oedothorax gibbosus]|uniref:Uncharacterized protein n=1 Tax=Oedothorax gibbosus TaxID=931172 RepID=A0AAV6UPM7_9ARAC|nr:hypothetical protein JTE90_022733 [Oedothorax gibbosus]
MWSGCCVGQIEEYLKNRWRRLDSNDSTCLCQKNIPWSSPNSFHLEQGRTFSNDCKQCENKGLSRDQLWCCF